MIHPHLLACISILLWASLAALGLKLAHVPPFLLVGLGLAFGSLPALRKWKIGLGRPGILAFGTTGIFGYHFLLFVSMRQAPAIEANLINYTWPVLLVLLSGAVLPGFRLGLRHLFGAVLAFSGAALIITGGHFSFKSEFSAGYLMAFGAALTWSTYSVLTRKLPTFPTATVGGFCFISAVLSLFCHAWMEAPVILSLRDWLLIAILGLGPMGVAFYTWDAALKKGDPRVIGALSYFTPLLSTVLLAGVSGKGALTWSAGVALALILAGALVSSGIGRARGRVNE